MAKQTFNGKVMTRKKNRKDAAKVPVKARELSPKTWDEVENGIGSKAPPKTVKAKNIKKYPPPSENQIFVAKWSRYIDDIAERENFKLGHLDQLEVLCQLFVDAARLEAFIDKNGDTYNVTGGRNGFQVKQYPQVSQLNKVRSEIRSYSKILGILLVKDKSTTDPKEKEDEWS